MYLIADAQESKFVGLLTDGSAGGSSLSAFFTSTGAPPVYTTGDARASVNLDPATITHLVLSDTDRSAPSATTSASAAGSTPRPVSYSANRSSTDQWANDNNTVYDSSPFGEDTSSKRHSLPINTSSAANLPPPPPPPPPSKVKITTSVVKGENGIGLDLGKGKDGEATVLKLKDFGPGIVNPASLCNPPILPGDVIVAVNGVPCLLFADAVKLIRGSEGTIKLTLERRV